MYNPGSTDRRSFEGGSEMLWARMLAYITGTVDQELLLRNEYLAAENRILKSPRPRQVAVIRRRKSHLGGDCLPAGTESLGRIGGGRETGYAAGLVPNAHRPQVGRLKVS